jgi:hypothetical protein
METKQTAGNALAGEVLPILIIAGAYIYKFKNTIEEELHDPLFMTVSVTALVFLVFNYYSIGHEIEKYLNRIKMKRFGIKLDDKDKGIAFPFIDFDLQKQVDGFYENGKNRDRTLLGLNAEKKNQEIVSIADIQRSHHLQVLGMTGTGKTTGVFLPLIYQDALKNRPVIILDAKGELSFINQLNALLASIGRSQDFLLFSLVHKEKSCSYNPLYVGECDPQVVIDAFFSNFKDENSFYRQTAHTIFTNVFYVLYYLEKPFTVMDVYTYLTNSTCKGAVDREVRQRDNKGVLYLKLLNTHIHRLIEQYKGWQHVITGFNNYLLDHKEDFLNEPDSDIVLTDVIRNRKVVYFQLPTNAYPIQAISIARMVQANLRYISSLIQTGQIPKDILVSVIIDEYGSFAEESFVEVLNKARSSGMMVTIAHQSLSDLKAISESFMKRIDENTVNKLYLKQTDPELCELIAKSMGTYMKEEKTYRMTGGRFGNQIFTGESSNRVVNEFYFPPDKIKNLNEQWQGYYIHRAKNAQACVNLGHFKNLPEMSYDKKARNNKKEGLKLFETYYVQLDENDGAEEQTINKKISQSKDLAWATAKRGNYERND